MYNGKGGKYSEKKNLFFLRRRRLMVKEKEGNIWRRKICFFLQRRRKTEKEKVIICKRPVRPDDHMQEAGGF